MPRHAALPEFGFLPLPLRDSGHGGGTTLTALVEQDADELSFYCWALDVVPPTTGGSSGP